MLSTHVAADDVAAIVFEPQQGEGGFVPADPVFVQGLRAICDEHGIVLVADEVQTGFGRTGRMFAMQHFDVEPDLIVLAKSIAGGLPLSGVVGRAAIMDDAHEGAIGGTFVGNLVALAAALAVLDIFDEEELVPRSAVIGETIRERMLAWQARWPQVGATSAVGAMLAIELVDDPATKSPAPELTTAVVDEAPARPDPDEGRRVRELHPGALSAHDLGRRARRGARLGRGPDSRPRLVTAPRLGKTSPMVTCATCGALVPEEARFCPSCGAEQDPTPRAVEERKLATVLFADLVGSTAQADEEDPERVRVLQERFFDAMTEEIERTGGTIEKFAGDAVMAAFGAPAALGDYAERALHAASRCSGGCRMSSQGSSRCASASRRGDRVRAGP